MYVNSVPLREREAFYLEAAGKHREAVERYSELLSSGKIVGDLNLAKAYLNYGHGLWRLKREPEARHALVLALEHAGHLHVISRAKDRKIEFNPLRLQLVCYGFLAQLGTDSERLDALEKRGALLLQASAILDDWAPTVIRNLLQEAELLSKAESSKSPRLEEAKTRLDEALVAAEKYGDVNQYLGAATFQAAKDYMIFAELHPELSQSADSKRLMKIVENSLKAYNAQTPMQPQIAFQKSKLEALWSGYAKKP